jgi:deoxyribonuclease V
MAVVHRWDVPPEAARAIQEGLRGRVERADRLGAVELVAGVDVAYPVSGVARAAVAVLDAATLALREYAVVERAVTFPYVPSLLSFREVPVVLEVFHRLARPPDLLICDGQGVAHPRRLGLASHLGLALDLPTVGAAKSLLVGIHGPLGAERGAWVPLVDGDEVVGAVVRTRTGVRPLYVSVGHRVSLETAVAWVLGCAPRTRLPETTRAAHALASRLSRANR